MITGSLSFDRVTFLLFAPRLSLWGAESDSNVKSVEMLKDFVSSNILLSDDFPQGSSSDLFLYHFRSVSGVDIQFGTKKPRRIKLDDLLLQNFGSDDTSKFEYLPNEFSLRIEYNPNKNFLSDISPLLLRFYDSVSSVGIRIARLDIAFDYKTEINPFLFNVSGMKKSFTAAGSSGLESVYFGSRSSLNYIRLYNKRQEILEKESRDIGHPLWRLELESKKSFMLSDPPDFGSVFDRVSFYSSGLKSDDWKVNLILQLSMLQGLNNVIRELPKATQHRYRDFLKYWESIELEKPIEIYKREFPGLYGSLARSLFTSCGVSMWEH